MRRDEARLILDALEAATDGNWPNTRAALFDAGYQPEEITDAWRALEAEAGRLGSAPEPGDF